MKKDVKILGHRGYSAKYPENSRLAFMKAIEEGALGFECDLQKSKDGHFIIFHDDTIDRICKSSGRVDHFTLEELKGFDIGEGETILELTELLQIIPNHAFINFEIKRETINSSDCPQILDIILRYKKHEDFIISSFEHNFLDYFKRMGIKIGLLIGPEYQGKFFGILMAIRKVKPHYLNLPVQMFDYLGNRFAHMVIALLNVLFRKKYMFWSVDNEVDFNNIIKYTDFIITNEVEFIVEKLELKV